MPKPGAVSRSAICFDLGPHSTLRVSLWTRRRLAMFVAGAIVLSAALIAVTVASGLQQGPTVVGTLVAVALIAAGQLTSLCFRVTLDGMNLSGVVAQPEGRERIFVRANGGLRIDPGGLGTMVQLRTADGGHIEIPTLGTIIRLDTGGRFPKFFIR